MNRISIAIFCLVVLAISASVDVEMLAAQDPPARVLIGSRAIQDRLSVGGAEHVAIEELLRGLGFGWTLRGDELVLQRGGDGGPRIRSETLTIRVGDRLFPVDAVRAGTAVYVPLEEVLEPLGYRSDHEARTRTVRIVGAGVGGRMGRPPPPPAPPSPAALGAGLGGQVIAMELPSESGVEVEAAPTGPDVPPNWVRVRPIDQPQTLRFRWRTSHPEAASGRWRVRREGSWGAPVEGSAGNAPNPNSHGFFNIDFSQFAPGAPPTDRIIYHVDVEVRDAGGTEPVSTTTPVRVVYQASHPPAVTLLDEAVHQWRTIEVHLTTLDYQQKDDDLSNDEPYLILVGFRMRTAVTPQGRVAMVPGTLQVARFGSSTHENLRTAQNWAGSGKSYGIHNRGLRIREQLPTGQPGWLVGMVVVFMEEDGWTKSTATVLRDRIVSEARTALQTTNLDVDATAISDAVVEKISAGVTRALRRLDIGGLVTGLVEAVDPDDFGGVNVVFAATLPEGRVAVFAGQPPADEAELTTGSKIMTTANEPFALDCPVGNLSAVPGNARFKGRCTIRGTARTWYH
jgi:hypothetical protein